jgi:hypothetical protein
MTKVNEGHAPQCTISALRRSIAVVGDDPLMVRALDRLLRTAGYNVGVSDRFSDQVGPRSSRSPRPDIALTIVDVPDDWARTHVVGTSPERPRDVEPGKILWISAAPSFDDAPEGCLVKPFTSSQLLDKVRALLSRQPIR